MLSNPAHSPPSPSPSPYPFMESPAVGLACLVFMQSPRVVGLSVTGAAALRTFAPTPVSGLICNPASLGRGDSNIVPTNRPGAWILIMEGLPFSPPYLFVQAVRCPSFHSKNAHLISDVGPLLVAQLNVIEAPTRMRGF
ncbi:hypothetical protein F4775DRAFT_589566 [Biscogniauxia sp. FL1348]|nr:hypothetical protein F4775DRAFT_589566 [Biscogniauxia sp. FL1348]